MKRKSHNVSLLLIQRMILARENIAERAAKFMYQISMENAILPVIVHLTLRVWDATVEICF